MSHASAVSEKNIRLLNKRVWDIVIVDEAHNLREVSEKDIKSGLDKEPKESKGQKGTDLK